MTTRVAASTTSLADVLAPWSVARDAIEAPLDLECNGGRLRPAIVDVVPAERGAP